jgi:putative PIN family toxin of toxin-antitoxin system
VNIVFDTNVLISSILIEGSIADLVLTKAEKYHNILCSDKIYVELVKILMLPKFDKYVSLYRRKKFIESFKNRAIFVKVEEVINACRDPKDNIFLELAVSGNAHIIISGDKDLLELNPFRNIRIISPKEFIEQI